MVKYARNHVPDFATKWILAAKFSHKLALQSVLYVYLYLYISGSI